MGNGCYRVVSKPVFLEIERKKRILESDPEYYLKLDSKKKKLLQKEAAKHSVGLELEGYDTTSVSGRKIKARETTRCEENLFRALEWGKKHFTGEISRNYIEGLARRIDPEINDEGFRKGDVRILNARISPPSYNKLNREFEAFMLENKNLSNPIGKAVHAHFHLARIHPFFDGNGRLSRLVQNIVLDNSGYFPIRISVEDRLEYLNLIDSAVTSYWVAEGSLKDSSEFFNSKQELFDHNKKSSIPNFHLEDFVLDKTKSLLTSEQNEFYDFLALKLRDNIQTIWNSFYSDKNNFKS